MGSGPGNRAPRLSPRPENEVQSVIAMQRAEVKQELQSVFRKVFDDDALEITDEMTAKDVAAWDSLNHINLVVAVEQRFKVTLTTKEVTSMKNVGEFISLILQKLG